MRTRPGSSCRSGPLCRGHRQPCRRGRGRPRADDRSAAGTPHGQWQWSCRSRRARPPRRDRPCRPLASTATDCGSCTLVGVGWAWASAHRCSPSSWSRTASVVGRRSVTCSVTGRPSRRHGIRAGGAGARARHCCSARAARWSIRATTCKASAPAWMGRKVARWRATSAWSQVEDSSVTRRSASPIRSSSDGSSSVDAPGRMRFAGRDDTACPAPWFALQDAAWHEPNATPAAQHAVIIL